MNRRTALGLLGSGGVAAGAAASPAPVDIDTELHLDRSIGWVFPVGRSYRVAIEPFSYQRGGARLIVFSDVGRLSTIIDVPLHPVAADLRVWNEAIPFVEAPTPTPTRDPRRPVRPGLEIEFYATGPDVRCCGIDVDGIAYLVATGLEYISLNDRPVATYLVRFDPKTGTIATLGLARTRLDAQGIVYRRPRRTIQVAFDNSPDVEIGV